MTINSIRPMVTKIAQKARSTVSPSGRTAVQKTVFPELKKTTTELVKAPSQGGVKSLLKAVRNLLIGAGIVGSGVVFFPELNKGAQDIKEDANQFRVDVCRDFNKIKEYDIKEDLNAISDDVKERIKIFKEYTKYTKDIMDLEFSYRNGEISEVEYYSKKNGLKFSRDLLMNQPGVYWSLNR